LAAFQLPADVTPYALVWARVLMTSVGTRIRQAASSPPEAERTWIHGVERLSDEAASRVFSVSYVVKNAAAGEGATLPVSSV
jgi:hypothetical protein